MKMPDTTRRTLLGSTLLGARAALGKTIGPPIAETLSGRVRGYTAEGVAIFRGIPYGGSVDGRARFLPAPKPEKWAGVRDAVATGPRAVQGPGNIFLSETIGEYFGGGRPDRLDLARQADSENCLALNVLTKGLRGKRPVMVYIHGGGFTGGSSLLTLFSDRFVREEDVVLVGVNHRINVFGYTYLGGLSDRYPDSGNLGQLDLVAALAWVRDNIAAFGGDPGNVTIFGESGGGAKISALLAMPAAKGLFHKAIVESGSALRVSTKEQATQRARVLLGKLGLDENRVDELQQIPAAKLFEAGVAGQGPGPGIGPVIDGRSILQQTWEPDAPETSAGIPMLIGTCKDESSLFSLKDEALFRLDEAGLRERVVKSGIAESEASDIVSSYRKHHPNETLTDLYFRIATDRGPRRNGIIQADRKSKQGKGNVFLYYFAWNTPLVDGKIKAFHTAELPLAMRLVRFPESDGLSKRIAGAWAAFARSGSPNRHGLPDWPAYSAPRQATMIFDAANSGAVDAPCREELAMLWKEPMK